MTSLPEDLARLTVEERRALLVQLLEQKLAQRKSTGKNGHPAHNNDKPVKNDDRPKAKGSRAFSMSVLADALDSINGGEAPNRDHDQTGIDLGAEAVLDPTIVPRGQANDAWLNPGRVLLTGATGFLGAFLLRELLDETRATVYCLVRATDCDNGLRRIKENLESYGLWDESVHGRVVPVPGNLARPYLGLNEGDFDFLADRLDAIYHSGALVNFLANYEALKSANVLGTHEVLRLACRKRVKPVHFVSTLAVVPVLAFADRDSVPELDDLDPNLPVFSGYGQSKWVADKLVLKARDRGLPVTVYRPGLISGHSVSGVCNQDDALSRVLQACLQFHLAPQVDMRIDMTPVDYVSRAVVYLSRRRESLGRAFHLANPRPLAWGQLLGILRGLGHPVEEVPYNLWQRFLAGSAASAENPLAMLSPLFTQVSGRDKVEMPDVWFDCRRAEAALAPTTIRCPTIDETLIRRYVAYLSGSGFLPTPQRLAGAWAAK